MALDHGEGETAGVDQDGEKGDSNVSVPYNSVDAARIRLLLNLVDEHPDGGQLDIYVSDDYVSLQVRGHGIPKARMADILRMLPGDALINASEVKSHE